MKLNYKALREIFMTLSRGQSVVLISKAIMSENHIGIGTSKVYLRSPAPHALMSVRVPLVVMDSDLGERVNRMANNIIATTNGKIIRI